MVLVQTRRSERFRCNISLMRYLPYGKYEAVAMPPWSKAFLNVQQTHFISDSDFMFLKGTLHWKKTILSNSLFSGFHVHNRFNIFLVKYQLRWCEIIYSVNCEIETLQFLWNKINLYHTLQAYFILRSDISCTKCISQILKGFISLKKRQFETCRFF